MSCQIRSPPSRYDGTHITQVASRDQRGGRSSARPKETDREAPSVVSRFQPPHGVVQPLCEEVDIENVRPILAFGFRKQIEQQCP
jgi:hypothetical protein